MATRPVTVSDIIAGHAVLDLVSADRIYLNGYIPTLQVGGQVVAFLAHRGFPIPSPAALGKIGNLFRIAVRRFAEINDIAVVQLRARDRKIEVAGPYLERARRLGGSRVAMIGWAQEPQSVFDARKRATDPGRCPQFTFEKVIRHVTAYYFYLWDEDFGACFIKVCAYAPYPVKVWLNGHEWAKSAAARAGVGFTELSNGFAACDDPDALQGICARLQAGTITVFFERWMARLPLPLNAADRAAGWWWQLSMRQVEVSRTIAFDQPRQARGFFTALLRHNLDIGRPERVAIIFGRRLTRAAVRLTTFATTLLQAGDQVVLNAYFRHSRIKQYLKDGVGMRVETVVNDPADLGCKRGIEHFAELTARAVACNDRLLHYERVGQDCVFGSPAFERVSRPSVTAGGRRVPAIRYGDPRGMALAGALCTALFAVTGITNASLRAAMTGLLGGTYTRSQATYDLTRLRLKELITRIPGTFTYRLTSDGIRFAAFYTLTDRHLLRPLMAADQLPASPELRRALRVLTSSVEDYAAEAGLRPARQAA